MTIEDIIKDKNVILDIEIDDIANISTNNLIDDYGEYYIIINRDITISKEHIYESNNYDFEIRIFTDVLDNVHGFVILIEL